MHRFEYHRTSRTTGIRLLDAASSRYDLKDDVCWRLTLVCKCVSLRLNTSRFIAKRLNGFLYERIPAFSLKIFEDFQKASNLAGNRL